MSVSKRNLIWVREATLLRKCSEAEAMQLIEVVDGDIA